MPNHAPSEVSRRDFLRLSWALTAGLAVPPALQGCRGGGGASIPLPVETFVEPQTLQSVGGLLDMTLRVANLSTTVNGKAVTLRNMFGTIPAPTLRINVGDTLRILLVNQLPPNPPSSEPAKHLRYPNSTNLHTHGLHVNPGLVAPGIYGDYVVDDPDLGVKPGEFRQHQFHIRHDHSPGTYWYHPHLHGSSAIQVGSGMAGALIIMGEIDQVPEIAAAQDRVFMFQAPISNATGDIDSFTDVANNPTGEPPFLINGVRRPRIVMRRGEVQHWRFINAGIFKYLNLALDGHALNVYSHDGNPRRNLLPIGPFPPNPPLPVKAVVLAPGNRAGVLVKAEAPGTYYLRTLAVQMGREPATIPEDIVAEVVVIEDPKPMALPAGPLPVPPFLAPITDAEFAAAGGLKRNIVLRAVFNPPPAGGGPNPPITDPPASNVLHPGSEIADWLYLTDDTSVANHVYAIGAATGQASPNPGLPAEYIPFQSARALKQTVALDSVEEWTIFNMNNIGHPFHIHVNPFEVIRVNGKPVEPYWADTIALPPGGTPTAPTSITFRTRFRHFTGAYVMHCHMLVHEDMGMMQTVEVV